MFLKISQNSQENTCSRVSVLIKSNFVKIEILAQVFPCEFCEISKNTFLQNTSGRLLLLNWKRFSFISSFLYQWRWLMDQVFNLLSANPTKWPNKLKQFVENLPTNCLSVFDRFVKLALKGLKYVVLDQSRTPLIS